MSTSTEHSAVTVAAALRRSGSRGRVLRGADARAATRSGFTAVADLDTAGSPEEFLSRMHEGDRRRVEEAVERGYAEGFERGQMAGYEAGIAELAARAASALSALADATRRLQARDAVALSELDTQIAGFAVDVAGSLLGRELRSLEDPGAAAIARAIALAPDRGAVTVRLHPADIELLGAVDPLAPGREIHVVADASVEPGGCLLEVGACRVDAQLGAALDRVRTVLGADPSSAGSAGSAGPAAPVADDEGRAA